MRETIFIFGVNHRQTPVAIRERLAYADGEIVAALARLKQAAPAIQVSIPRASLARSTGMRRAPPYAICFVWARASIRWSWASRKS
jgi:hypothetical protein